LGKWCLGLEEPEDPFLPKRNQMFFALYTVASVVYRWVILFSILYFLYHVFKPYGLQIIGQLIGLVSLVGLVIMPLWQLGKFFYVPGRLDKVKKKNLYVTLAALAAVAGFLLFVPLPYHVLGTAEIRPREAAPVYVESGGRLRKVSDTARPGMAVVAGQTIAVLENYELEAELLKLETQKAQYEERLLDLVRRSFSDPGAALDIPTVEQSLAAINEQIKDRKEQIEKLTLKAPVAGVVLPAHSLQGQPTVDGGLPSMSGTPFEAKNLGAVMQHQQEFCQIGDPKRWEARLIVDQSDAEFVAEGQVVALRLEQLPLEDIDTRVDKWWNDPLKYVPKNLSNKAGGEIATETDAKTGMEKPQSTHYQGTTVELDSRYAPLFRPGLKGQAKIRVEPQTIAARFWRFIRQTFNFKL
jgi:putative peptide zinc metalloprotease protein